MNLEQEFQTDPFTQYFIDIIREDPEYAQECTQEISDYIASSSAGNGDEHHSIHTMPIPKFYSIEMAEDFQQIVAITYQIFAKVIDAYMTDANVRKIFGFSKEMKDLILLDRGYKCPLPIARFDIFYHEDTGDFKFCEINTDGTSAMNENRELINSLTYNGLFMDFAADLASQNIAVHHFEYFQSWVNEFINIYSEFTNAVDHPYIAIVDFLENAYMEDFIEFQKVFIREGYECEICDIRKLTYENGALISPSGHKIDAIYRRAVTSDIMKHLDEVQPLITAYKEQAVCLIGSFATQIIHNKQLFIALRNETLQNYLTAPEVAFIEAHVPYTNAMTMENVDADHVIETKNKWILKPLDSYAASGIYLGYDYKQKEWVDIISKCCENGHYLYQEYYVPYQSPNIDCMGGDEDFSLFYNMNGLYVYHGHLAGIYTRVCKNRLIAGQFGGKELPSVVVDTISQE